MRPVQVISLERSAERRAEFRRRNPGLAFEFFKAVDGAALSAEAIAATGLFRPGLDYTVGAYGVALSHHALWEECIRAGEPVTVAEDDAIFREDFAGAQAGMLARLPAGWDFILWGWNFDSSLSLHILPNVRTAMAFDHERLRAMLGGFAFTSAAPQPYRLEHAFGLPAYTISPSGAKKLKARCFPIADFTRSFTLIPEPVRNTGLDTALSNIYPGADCYVSLPPLVVTPNDRAVSTIQNGQYYAP
jgi:GR25 family glycosyltransferase involved in LPS biosynthesis